ncbi:hypothetical protein [Nocardioides iriomotensis]|uniref:WD40 repeat domain-containing protein n=1 Tax=Nocardioides iriomotensis TaxID=715784 RepID=A0A4Q5JAK1_9ACTN|nr:hypothetical protein [Nocardioides iriomotensis]RYU15684.1 hypothetical protein ETU37_00780 [Nocardioides iriomotensis]
MSNHQTDDLTRALRARSEDMTGTHVAFEDVKGRARGIRRRRRAASGIAVAAVALAVAVPMGINLGGVDNGQRPLPADQPTTTTEPTGPVTPTPQGPVEIDAAKAPRGEDPAILYATGTTLHRPDGPQVELPKQYSYLLPYADGVMGFYGPDGITDFIDGEGNLTDQGPYTGMSGAISSDGERLATWVSAVGAGGAVDLALWPRSGANPENGYTSNVVAMRGDMQLAGFVGPETVAYNLTVSTNQGATQTPYVTDWTSEPRELTSLMDVRGANDVTGVVSGLTTVDYGKNEYCFAVVKAVSDTVVWDTCDYRLGRFSPDGKYVLGVDPESDGLGGKGVTILDAETGEVVAEFQTEDRAFMQDAIWESRSTVLAPVMQDGAWFLVRMRPDGTVEKALDASREGYDDSSPWRFQYTP